MAFPKAREPLPLRHSIPAADGRRRLLARLPARALFLGVFGLFASTVLGPAPAAAQTPSASEIVEAMIRRQEAELDHVRNYWVDEEQNGARSKLYYENRTVDGRKAFVSVPESEYIRRLMQEKGIDPSRNPATSRGGGGGQGGMGGMGNPAAGLQGKLLQGGMGKLGSQLAESSQTLATPDPELMRAMAARATVTGTEEVDGHRAWVLEIRDFEGLDLTNGEGGMEDFTPTSARLLIDTDRHVSLRDEFAGVVHSDGDHEIRMVVRYGDYREVDGMLRPFHTVIEVGGLMEQIRAAHGQEIDAARQQGEEAAGRQPTQAQRSAQSEAFEKQMKQLQEQLDKMPPEQRARVEPMIRQQMAMLRQSQQAMETHDGKADFEKGQAALGSAMSSGAFTVETVVHDMKVNAGPPEPEWMKQLEKAQEGGAS